MVAGLSGGVNKAVSLVLLNKCETSIEVDVNLNMHLWTHQNSQQPTVKSISYAATDVGGWYSLPKDPAQLPWAHPLNATTNTRVAMSQELASGIFSVSVAPIGITFWTLVIHHKPSQRE